MNITSGKWKLGNTGAIYTDDLRVMIANVVGLDLGIRPDEAIANANAISLVPNLIEALHRIEVIARSAVGHGIIPQRILKLTGPILKRIEG